ncbi:hypothetical protein HS041_22450 [Planomonospora sp. ID67723]|uniref:hypothetical protein n=1 Tax=Planomonospora sp. ID67723 TaxID=2738134 RepID=UPI0018C3C2F3|nr:hypothetical protein [Planomonospora sp. ID67723]MBG0830526.1 hypothetical protein [Planomonospora sp. ID67723]
MARFRKTPIEVEAIQWTGDNEDELIGFTGALFQALDPEDRSDDPDATGSVFDVLHSTWVLVYTGQWVVKGVKGEFYPIAEDVLAETYEPAESASLPIEIRQLVHAVDQMRDGWVEADHKRRHELWRAVRRADDSIWFLQNPSV